MTTTDQFLDLDGIGQRQDTFAFELLDASLAHLGWVDVVEQDDSGLTAPVITNDTAQIIQRQLSGFDLPPDQGAEFEEVGARIRPWLTMENGATAPLGTFVFVDARRIRSQYGVAFEGTLGDLGLLVHRQSTETNGLRVGALIETEIARVLEQQGIFDYLIDTTGIRIAEPIAWPAGTSWKVIVDALAVLMGCLPLYFDADGTARVRLIPNLTADPVDVIYLSGRNIFDTGIADWNTILTAPNYFKVIGSGFTGSDIVGTYSLPDSAPNSEFNVGRTPDVTNQQGMASVTVANEAARLRSITNGTVVENIAFDGPPDWRNGTFSIIAALGDRYLERRWTLTCGNGGPMSHEASKVYS